MLLLTNNRLRTQLFYIVFQGLFKHLHNDLFIVNASAGPRQNTLSDMWRMIWQLNINRIVMVTQLSENGKVMLASVISCSLCKQATIPWLDVDSIFTSVYARLKIYFWYQGMMIIITTTCITIFRFLWHCKLAATISLRKHFYSAHFVFVRLIISCQNHISSLAFHSLLRDSFYRNLLFS